MSRERRGCLPSAFGRLFRSLSGKKPEGFPYRVRDDFLTPAEMSFFRVLKEAVGDNVLICPKVSLADLFFVTAAQHRMSYFARIAQKRVDFVLCDPRTLKPMGAIELDDPSHGRHDRAARDVFVQGVFDAAGLPLLHQQAKRSYTRSELVDLLVKVYERQGAADDPPDPADDPPGETDGNADPPICPKCGVPMVLRTVRQGRKKGHKFYGCPNYPQCRAIYRLSDLGMSPPAP